MRQLVPATALPPVQASGLPCLAVSAPATALVPYRRLAALTGLEELAAPLVQEQLPEWGLAYSLLLDLQLEPHLY